MSSTISSAPSRQKLREREFFVKIHIMFRVCAWKGIILSIPIDEFCGCKDLMILLIIILLNFTSACPLANSSYATIREEEGNCYLFLKTAERAHTPKYLWEKIKLPNNYTKALELVSTHLEHFPKFLIHRNKQRLTKIHQMLIRMRKLKLRAK